MKLEAGKRYVRRDGTVTPPLINDDSMFKDPEHEWVYDNGHKDGCKVFPYPREHPHDLIAEYVPPIITRLEAIQKMADEAAVKLQPYEDNELAKLYHAVTELICDVQDGKV